MSMGNDNLQQALRALSESTREGRASAGVKVPLLREIKIRRRKSLAVRWWPAFAAAVAALVVGIWIGAPRRTVPVAQDLTARVTEPSVGAPLEVPAVMAEPVRPAVNRTPRATLAKSSQLTPLTPWYVHSGLIPMREGQVMYLDVGPETARRFGLSVTGPIKAEVFVGDDGMARAIRLVRTPQIAKGE